MNLLNLFLLFYAETQLEVLIKFGTRHFHVFSRFTYFLLSTILLPMFLPVEVRFWDGVQHDTTHHRIGNS